MGRIMILFLLILLINLLIVIVYLLWNTIVQKEKNRSVWMKAFVMFICPVVGPFFFFFAYLLYKAFMSQAMDLEEKSFPKWQIKFRFRIQKLIIHEASSGMIRLAAQDCFFDL